MHSATSPASSTSRCSGQLRPRLVGGRYASSGLRNLSGKAVDRCQGVTEQEPVSGPDKAQMALLSRRSLFAAPAMGLVATSQVGEAQASARFEGMLPLPPPDPVKIPRKTVEQRFAVLMMRTPYEVVDSLDFMPMDEFQVKFWKFRQSEWEPYKLSYSPLNIRLGDLTDPLYFDFIQYSQYTVINREMPKGRQVFEEFCENPEDCPENRKRIVQRDPLLSDNRLLPGAMEQRIGDKFYSTLLNGFEGLEFGAPPPLAASAPFADVVAGVQRIVDIYVQRGFAIKGEVAAIKPDATGNGGKFVVRMQAPCNLWGLQRLGSTKSALVNATDAMTIGGFLRASGRSASYELELENNNVWVRHEWVLDPTSV